MAQEISTSEKELGPWVSLTPRTVGKRGNVLACVDHLAGKGSGKQNSCDRTRDRERWFSIDGALVFLQPLWLLPASLYPGCSPKIYQILYQFPSVIPT